MNSGERRHSRAAAATLALACLVLGGASFGGNRLHPVPHRLGLSQRSGDKNTTQALRGQCSVDTECDDGDVCTAGRCEAGACVVTEIPRCVRCQPTFICPTIDAVFVMDTSGSMRDEAAALCAGIDEVVADFALQGITLTTHVFGITDTGDQGFSCLTDDVVTLFGDEVPGELAFCPFPDDISSFESWGPGTAIVAERFPWVEGAARVVIPMSDEGPCNGSRPDGCSFFGEDRDAVDNAALVSILNDVQSSPITGSGSDDCVRGLAQALADNTGGRHEAIKDPATIPDAIRRILFNVCTPDPTCDDLDVCTDNDTCTDGVCRGEPNFDQTAECCNPDDRTLTPLSDGNDCTMGVCDTLTGGVEQVPVTEGTACDDGDACTTMELCDGAGTCNGTDINTFECTTDDDCFGAICDTDAGRCFCTHTPTLSLVATPGDLPDATCHTVGDIITVDVRLGFSTRTVTGGNFLIGYDPAALEFLDVVPGAESDPASPFSIKLFRNIDDVAGRIAFAVGIELGTEGTRGPTTMATATFRAKTSCTTDQLCLLDDNPFTTKLSDETGQEVPFERRCTDVLVLNGPAPAFSCPDSVVLNADAGGTRATVTWDPVSVQSDCNADLAFTCTAAHDLGADIDGLIQGGGLFPSGVSTFHCTTSDDCGATGACTWTVEVRRLNTLDVSLELSPAITADPAMQPLERCISFELFSNCVQPPAVVEQTIEFGLPFNLTGHAEAVLVDVPAGQYACVTARDTKHTLRSSSPLQKIDGRYVARFEGDPFFDGNWLVGGNMDGNRTIDILDFGALLDQYLTPRPVDTPCGLIGPHGDFNGDGFVDTFDLSFVSLNFLKADKASCCPQTVAGGGPQPQTRVPLAALERIGVRDPRRLDTNGDGTFDLSDVRELLGHLRQGSTRHIGR